MNIVDAGSAPTLVLSVGDEQTPANEPVTGQTVTVAVRRLSDDKWFNFVAVTWDTIATYALLDASNKQALTDKGDGTYEFDWNQATADAGAVREYEMVFAVPSGDYRRMAYETWSFRAPAAAAAAAAVWNSLVASYATVGTFGLWFYRLWCRVCGAKYLTDAGDKTIISYAEDGVTPVDTWTESTVGDQTIYTRS